MSDDSTDTVRRYHEATKHHLNRYAPSRGYLDWATQPHPFRRFAGTELFRLPFPEEHDTPPFEAIYAGAAEAAPVAVASIARLFYFSLAISAWKQHGDSKWALRVNPSSGNLHPTEAYIAIGAVPGLSDRPAVYHYAPDVHGLERRADLETSPPEGAMLVVLTSIHWREAWKYGARAYRYCHHDVGHALVALRCSAALLGWPMPMVPGVERSTLAVLTGLDRADGGDGGEEEHADTAFWIHADPAASGGIGADEVIAALCPSRFHGTANRLSATHHPWPVIDDAARAVARSGVPRTEDRRTMRGQDGTEVGGTTDVPAGVLIRKRRSAVSMDGRTSMTRDVFHRMLAKTLPSVANSPWDALPWSPGVHLGLFVHRVDGLAPGLYLLVRGRDHEASLRSTMRDGFRWRRPEGTPEGLDLFCLVETDTRDLARTVSCHQDIAADGAFSCSMLARFEPELGTHGAACYPQLFWETGAIGQVLYLEAEAAGLRATGIGCFFDDPVHEIFGLRDRTFQSLYHFTVGGPVEDTRITTLPAYGERG